MFTVLEVETEKCINMYFHSFKNNKCIMCYHKKKKKSQESGAWLPEFKSTIYPLNRQLKLSVPEFSHS